MDSSVKGRGSLGERQRRYYEQTAGEYDRMHVAADDEHASALERIDSALSRIGARSVLDVGCGTGRGIGYLLRANPDLEVKGIEPVAALVEQAIESNGIPSTALIIGSGENLPFPDLSFDAVISLGVLHHVPDPSRVVAEMLRVARQAIFISDANRFGHGRSATRLLKLALARAHLWKLAFRIRRLGRNYVVSEGDGIAFSYSVYDSVPLVAEWADWLEMSGLDSEPTGSWVHPLLTSPTILLSAGRNSPDEINDLR
jgi:ubiquinone/menaquinone biosynthesis C-methylase UbiE